MADAAEIYIYESEMKAITAEAQRYETAETGGDLYGSFTHAGMPVIWLASGPGPGAKHTGVEFSQDLAFISSWQKRLMSEYGIQYVGSWHSHHTLSLNQPSGGDVAAAQAYAKKHSRDKTLEILLNHEARGAHLSSVARAFYYPNALTGQWIAATIHILGRDSPLRPLLGRDEQIFSAGADWQTTHMARLALVTTLTPSRQWSATLKSGELPVDAKVSNVNEISTANEVSDESNTWLELLASAIEKLNIGIEDIELEQREKVLMIIVPLESKQSVAIAIQTDPSPQILQANYIDKRDPSHVDNQNMADLLRLQGIVLPALLHEPKQLQTIIETGRKAGKHPHVGKRASSFSWSRKGSGQN